MSDEVSNFLRSVEQLNSRRDEDEEARSRELEEKILQQRRERQARREGTYKYILRQALARIADLAFRCSRPVSRVEADLRLPARLTLSINFGKALSRLGLCCRGPWGGWKPSIPNSAWLRSPCFFSLT